jgi:pimeloyl-ACP methyl ester carboxylesterase
MSGIRHETRQSRRALAARLSAGPRRTVPGIIAALLFISHVTACTSTSGDESPEDPLLAFADCGDLFDQRSAKTIIPADRLSQLTFTCATLDVPVDHAQPGGDQIALQIMRATKIGGTDRIGALVLNPGGPGASGLGFLPYWMSWLSDDLLDTFDIVTFDPRGVGKSAPIHCGDLPQDNELLQYPDLQSAAGWAYATTVFSDRADGCLSALGSHAAAFNTQDTARDLDLLRGALGDEKLTYLGWSYGAKLGGEYAHQFPDRVRALVLDGPSNPTKDYIGIVADQVSGFEQSFDAYAAGCASRPSCAAIGDPQSLVLDLVRTANTSPIPSYRPGDDHPANGINILNGVLALLYDDAAWPHLDDSLVEAKNGDSGSLFEANDFLKGKYTRDEGRPQSDDAYYVISCNDAPPGPSEPDIKRAAAQLEADYEIFGALRSWELIECTPWSADRHVLQAPTAPKAPDLLVIGSLHDPATPYDGAVALAETLGNATLLTREGEGHTAYGQSDCINRLVDTYLISLAAPEPDTRCPA